MVDVADGEGRKRRMVARLQTKKQMTINSVVAITKLVVIPKLVNGRIELHYEGLPEGATISHAPQPVTNPVILDPQA